MMTPFRIGTAASAVIAATALAATEVWRAGTGRAPAARLAETPAVPPGTHEPVWLA